MTGHARRPSFLLGFVVALSITFVPLATPVATARSAPAAALLPAWDGSIDLYRDGVFTTQKSWLWCTAAGVQIVSNIVERDDDHSKAGQRRYFDWMLTRNRYDLPLSAGVDPAGWTAGLRPDTELSVERFRRFFTPWHYAPRATVWDGRYVAIQTVSKASTPPVLLAEASVELSRSNPERG